MGRRFAIECSELRQMYEVEQRGIVAIGQHYGCSATTIAHRLRACGISLRPSRFAAVVVPEELLRQLYLVERLPIHAIAVRLGVSVSTVHNRRRVLGITARSQRGRKGAKGAYEE